MCCVPGLALMQGGAPAMPSGLAGLLGELLMGGPSMAQSGQTPVLSCDRPFDLNTPLMLA